MDSKTTYPKFEQVASASRMQLCSWHRFLPSPENEQQGIILNEIERRYKEVGGMTPEISKRIGWTK